MKKFASLSLVVIVALLMSGWTTMKNGAIHTSYNDFIDFSLVNPIPIFNPCTGEFIDFSGTLHSHGGTTITPSGNVHVTQHTNLQGVSGIGLTTGNTYQYMNSFHTISHATAGQVYTQVLNSKIVSNGVQFNQDIHMHTTVNANGETTVSYTFMAISCD